mmetsp:Transcript_25824/g.85951  ORF Transcript_25824/g.85951 Transcript_25824/m.85951 type:complete len:261 (-) Transcript_25824:1577-2359(-)
MATLPGTLHSSQRPLPNATCIQIGRKSTGQLEAPPTATAAASWSATSAERHVHSIGHSPPCTRERSTGLSCRRPVLILLGRGTGVAAVAAGPPVAAVAVGASCISTAVETTLISLRGQRHGRGLAGVQLAARHEFLDLRSGQAPQPRMIKASFGGHPLLGQQEEHRQEEGREVPCLHRMHVVFLLQHICQSPVAQRLDVPEITAAVEVGHRSPALGDQFRRHWPQEFNEERQVILIARVLLRGLGVEEIVASDQLEYHAS